MTPATELADFLAQRGVGTRGSGDSAWSIFVSEEPTAPDKTITLYDSGGFDRLAEAIRQPTIQVRVRANDYQEGYEKHEQILQELHAIGQQAIGAHWYVGVFLQSDIISIGRDVSRRVRLTANYRIIRQPL